MKYLAVLCLSLLGVSASAERLLLTAEVTSLQQSIVSTPRHLYAGWSRKIVWMADEGAVVKAGEPLVSFDTEALQSRFDQFEEQLIAAEDNVAVQARTEALASLSAQRRIDVARLELEKARLIAERQTSFSSRKEIADAEFAVLSAELELEKALEAAEFTAERNRSQAQTRALNIERLRAEYAFAQGEIERSTIFANEDVLVIYQRSRFQERDVQIGDSLDPGSSVLKLLPLGGSSLRAWVSEVDANSVDTGVSVDIRFDKDPSQTVEGTITSVGDAGVELERRGLGRWVPVHIEFTGQSTMELSPGMSARVEVAQ
ncbi:HlyD family secretion protein [Umboniibacter marinipuniceus]|uniref:Multidrug resistance efflux pump n=1 Tax=Umboniibacter marinipuniceus TaxID=569599 RepID=A0A3M0A7B1_9GAMM|nr:HlyD family efflux transporter periplasmic adaptor subunit [Umboniibacter marinipuniceus]RMA80184.1 multidrug resistance efflux pump [Umboniibacter marinipuniceus]